MFKYTWGGVRVPSSFNSPKASKPPAKPKAPATKPKAPATKPAATAPAAGPPPKPALVDPFLTPEDMSAVNDFLTSWGQQNTSIDTNLRNQGIDTQYQETQNDNAAKANTAATADAMAARGLFQSSIKDASLYDIEAQRALANKFLDDKLTTATLDAGTQKKILGDSKTRFDEAMAAKKVQNASAVNDPLSQAWAAAMAQYKPPAAPAPSPAPKPAAPKPTPAYQPRYTWGGKKVSVQTPFGTFPVGKTPASTRTAAAKPKPSAAPKYTWGGQRVKSGLSL